MVSVSLDARTTTDLTSYAPRLLLQWEQDDADASHRSIEGTLVFADVSGFTRLSERLARAGGKSGAEEMTEIIGSLFGELLTVAARRGGEMLKYGGDAVLLFFRGPGHAPRAAAAAHEMQARLAEVGRVETGSGAVRLRMSVGMNSGDFDLFKVGGTHRELIVAGPATTETVRMEAAADAREILLSASTAALLDGAVLGPEKAGGRLLRRAPDAETVAIVPSRATDVAHRFVAPALREHLASGDVEPDHRLATVAFIHAMGMDALLAELGPAVVSRWLHETLCVIQDACEEFDVTFLATDLAADGTKVMAAAGAPRAGDDDERRMLLALRRMIEAEPPLPLRAGANRGHVFSAAVGPPYRKTYTTIGDVTNTAARVMGHAGPGDVLALGSVLDNTRGRFAVEELPPFVAKGKAAPLVPYRVVGAAAEPPEPVAIRLPLTGRDAELQQLTAALASARAGTGALVELVGDMGAGKTRLLGEVFRSADALEAVVVHCEPYHRSTPFHPFRQLLEPLVTGGDADPAAALRAAIEERATGVTPWLPLIAGVLDLEVRDTEETRLLDPRFRLQRTAAVTVELLRALLPEPTAIVLEDVHWLDEASAVVLRELEAAVPSSPWLIVVSRRNEPAAFVPVRPESTSIHLAPLSPTEMIQLVSLATGDTPLLPHQRDALVTRAAGNPLFLTELLDCGADADALPHTLEAVMAAQIDRLAPAERRLLRHAAVLGSRFDVDVLADLVGEPAIATAGARALTSRLQWLCVPEGPGQLRFRHQLIRDVAYESLPFRQRRQLHARAGELIERATGDDAAGILSMHYFHAGMHERCWTFANTAARRACRRFANVEAVELLERALAAVRHLPLVPAPEVAETWQLLGLRQTYLGSTNRARTAYQRARALVRDDPARFARLCLREARLAQRDGKVAAMLRLLRSGLRMLDGVDDDAASEVRADLALLQAWIKVSQGRPRQAVQWAELALREGERTNRQAVAHALTLLNNIDAAMGRPVDAERAATAVAILEELDTMADLAIVLNNLGMDEYYQGRWTTAMALFHRSRDAMTKVGNVIDAGYCTLSIAEILVEQGHLDDAEADLAELTPLWQSLDNALGTAYVDNQRARICVHRGKHVDAIELFASARAVFERNNLAADALDADARAAECLLRLGRFDEARRAVCEALAQDRAIGGTRAAPRLHRALAYCGLADGEIESAWTSLDESLHIARITNAPYEVALTLEAFALIGEVGGRIVAEDVTAERAALLAELGVVSTPIPPVPDATKRVHRRSPQSVDAPAS